MKNKLLSVIIPVYNEVKTVQQIVQMVQLTDTSPYDKEIIIVDDGSRDGTQDLLKQLVETNPELTVILHERNKGKGAALRTGFNAAQGEAVIIQDADMEYDPGDWRNMLPLLEQADVVYGSRFKGQGTNWIWSHWLGNRILSLFTSLLYGHWVSDMETCYKLIRKEVLDRLTLRANRFDIEPEITAKLLKQGIKFREVPISYRGRSFKEGKKINWRDAIIACWTLIKFRLVD
jgi:glycosyltransferase involved in cell wall biosynthesis